MFDAERNQVQTYSIDEISVALKCSAFPEVEFCFLEKKPSGKKFSEYTAHLLNDDGHWLVYMKSKTGLWWNLDSELGKPKLIVDVDVQISRLAQLEQSATRSTTGQLAYHVFCVTIPANIWTVSPAGGERGVCYQEDELLRVCLETCTVPQIESLCKQNGVNVNEDGFKKAKKKEKINRFLQSKGMTTSDELMTLGRDRKFRLIHRYSEDAMVAPDPLVHVFYAESESQITGDCSRGKVFVSHMTRLIIGGQSPPYTLGPEEKLIITMTICEDHMLELIVTEDAPTREQTFRVRTHDMIYFPPGCTFRFDNHSKEQDALYSCSSIK